MYEDAITLEISRCIEPGWDCTSTHSLTRIRGFLIILEKAFPSDDLGGLYVIGVERGHVFPGFFISAWLSF